MKPAGAQKGISLFSLIIFLILSCGALAAIKLRLDQEARNKVPGSSIIYIPSGKYLKFATLGNAPLAADLIYAWAIQYYSDYSIADRFSYLKHIFSIISELDPRNTSAYVVGALIAAHEARDTDLALELLDMGFARNPGQWILPFEAAHYAQLLKKDYRLAQSYYEKAIAVKGSPDILKRLYANVACMALDYETSLRTWLEIYRTARDESVKKIASSHLYQVKAALDSAAIKEAIGHYREKYRRNPMNLSQLVRSGYLKSVPNDFDGLDYVYDSRTGEVSTKKIPWKR